MSNSGKIFMRAMYRVGQVGGRTRMYPVTIISDRYSGTYSGGAWTAWPVETWEVPDDARGDDGECADFWHDYGEAKIGKGPTPESALSDLYAQWQIRGESE